MWVPGDLLYDPAALLSRRIVEVKDDEHDRLMPIAARWTPERGWHSPWEA